MKKARKLNAKPTTLVIAVGGRGSRIEQHFAEIGFQKPKVLFPIQGKPLLAWYLDHAEQSGFSNIVLLMNHFESDIREFLETRPPSKTQIRCVTANDPGNRTVPGLLSLFVDQYTEPFVYMDGNLFFDASLFALVKNVLLPNETLLRAFVSKTDIAPTHAQFVTNGSKVVDIINRPNRSGKTNNSGDGIFCSMGIFVIHPELFFRISEKGPYDDLDQVIEGIFSQLRDQNPACIDFQEYVGPWAALHTSADIDRMLQIPYNPKI